MIQIFSKQLKFLDSTPEIDALFDNIDFGDLYDKSYVKKIYIFLQFFIKYFDVEVYGLENLHHKSYIFAPNHSGSLVSFDGFILNSIIFKNNQYMAAPIFDRNFKRSEKLSEILDKMGAVYTKNELINSLKNGRSAILFPEGHHGFVKNRQDWYKLQHMNKGFIRCAIEARCPIMPVSIVGFEELVPNLGRITEPICKLLNISTIPIPLSLIPFPVKVYYDFCEPIETTGLTMDDKTIDMVLEKYRYVLQAKIDFRLSQRRDVYTSKIFNTIFNLKGFFRHGDKNKRC